MNHICTASIVVAGLWTGFLPAQKLRRAIAGANLVVIAKVIRVIPTKTHVIHRLRIEELLRGPANRTQIGQLSIVETKRVAQHNKPIPARSMLYCLHDIGVLARNARLPAHLGPYYKMSGYPGSAVVLEKARAGEATEDPRVRFARVLIASQKGQSPRRTAEELFAIALRGDKRVRIEAAESLAERAMLGRYLTMIHLSTLLARAAGETDDIPYKIALASICAERKMDALIPSLCVSVEHVGEESFLRALGRFARFIHKENADEALLTHVRRARGKTKDRLIFALGATSTEGALETLLDMQLRGGAHSAAVESALRIHGSPRATAAIAKKKSSEEK